MDHWTEDQIALMEAGGNATLADFFNYQGLAIDTMSVDDKYKV
jgi:hypothetical protein